MATFKVGQRVKRIRSECSDPILSGVIPIGATGTVTGPAVRDGFYCVNWDRITTTADGWAGWSLAPLTDPGADAWATDAVRKVTKPQHVEPVAPPIPVRERHV